MIRFHIVIGLAAGTILFSGAGYGEVQLQPSTVRFGTAPEIRIQPLGGQAAALKSFQPVMMPVSPRVLGQVDLKQVITDLGYAHPYVVAATGNSGIYVMDFSGAKPKVISRYTGKNAVDDIETSERRVYFKEDEESIALLDLKEPLFPEYINHFYRKSKIIRFKAHGKTVVGFNANKELFRVDFSARWPVLLKLRHLKSLPVGLSYNGSQVALAYDDGSVELRDLALRPTARHQGRANPLDVALGEQGVAYLADGHTGMTILRQQKEKQKARSLQWVGSMNNIGFSQQLLVNGTDVFSLSDGHRIVAMKMLQGRQPKLSYRYHHGRSVGGLAHDGHNLYIADGSRVSRFYHAGEQSYLSTEVNFGGSRKVVVRKGLAYVADWFSGLHIYDVRQPYLPRLLSSLPSGGSPKGIALRGDMAYLADDDQGLKVIDITDPLTPKLVTEFDTPGLAYSVLIRGTTLFLGDHSGGFQILDISDPEHLKRVSSVDTPGKVWALAVQGAYLYVADDLNGLLVYHLGDISAPRLVARLQTVAAAEDVVVDGGIAYLALYNGGVQVVDISDPQRPLAGQLVKTPGSSRAVYLAGKQLLVGDWQAGVQVYDRAGNNLKHRGGYDTPGYVWGLAVDGNSVYVMDWWSGFLVLDYSDRSHLKKVAGYHGSGKIHDIKSRFGYAYVASGHHGLQVFDVRTPANPIWVTGMETGGSAAAVSLLDKKAFVWVEGQGMEIFDSSNPRHLKRMGRLPWPASVEKIACFNDGGDICLLLGQKAVTAVTMNGDRVFHLPAAKFWLRGQRLLVQKNNSTRTPQLELYRIQQGRLNKLWDYELDAGLLGAWLGDDMIVVSTEKNLVTLPVSGEKPVYGWYGWKFSDWTADGNKLYARTASGEVAAFELGDGGPVLKAVYDIPEPFTAMVATGQTVYLAGSSLLSLSLLPSLNAKNGTDDIYQVSPMLPPGRYYVHMVDAANGRVQKGHTPLWVRRSAAGSGRFTLDDFQKVMQKRKLLESGGETGAQKQSGLGP